MPPELTTTYVFILASTSLYREAWHALLSGQPHIVPAGKVSDPSELRLLETSGQRTTILIDVPTSQVEVARQLHEVVPEIGLLVLVDAYDLGSILPLLRSGAMGCISHDAPVGELARAIIAVGRGEMALPPAVAGRALAALASGKSVGDDDDTLMEALTVREAEVLSLLAEGMTNKDIAQALILSVRTVEAHLRSIYSKLGVTSRTEAALWAVRNGYGPQD